MHATHYPVETSVTAHIVGPHAPSHTFVNLVVHYIRPHILLVQSISPSADQSVRPPVRPSVRPSVRPPVRPSTCPSVRPSVHPSGSPISPSVHPVVQSVRPSVRQSNQPRTSMLGLSPRASTAACPDRTMSAPSCPGCTFQAAPSVHAAHASSQSRPLDAHVILAHVILALAVLPCLQASAIVRTRMPLRSRASMNS